MLLVCCAYFTCAWLLRISSLVCRALCWACCAFGFVLASAWFWFCYAYFMILICCALMFAWYWFAVHLCFACFWFVAHFFLSWPCICAYKLLVCRAWSCISIVCPLGLSYICMLLACRALFFCMILVCRAFVFASFLGLMCIYTLHVLRRAFRVWMLLDFFFGLPCICTLYVFGLMCISTLHVLWRALISLALGSPCITPACFLSDVCMFCFDVHLYYRCCFISPFYRFFLFYFSFHRILPLFLSTNADQPSDCWISY